MEARVDGELWIGAPLWPAGVKAARLEHGEHWEGLGFTQFQIAGIFCHQQRFFGLKFHVPRADPLAVLMDSYLESSYPGIGNSEYATPLEEVVRLRDRLAEIDLVLDPIHYAKFAEAYFPISAQSAWQYAVRRRLPLFEDHRRSFDAPRTSIEAIGLETTWESPESYLRAYWERLARFSEPDERLVYVPESWTAVGHYMNSD